MFFLASLVASLGILGALHAWLVAVFPWAARRRRGVAAALFGLWLFQSVAGWVVVHFHVGHAGSVAYTGLMVVLMTLLLAGIPIGIVRATIWAFDRLLRRRPWTRQGAAPVAALPATGASEAMTRRQIAEGLGGLAILGATGSMLGWGMVRGRHAFELTEIAVPIAGLPRVLDGYVIAQISDIHAGTYVGERELREGLARVREARPDLLVVTGDVVDFDPSYAPLVARLIADLNPVDGVAAVLGNHDYYTGAEKVITALRAAGIDPLVNEGRVVRPHDGGGFALLGVDDLWALRYHRAGPSLDRALSMVPPDRPRVLLSHQPRTVDEWAGRVDLQLSGHTHGGQINPGFRPAALFLDYLAGAYRVGGTTLYVNRGFGTVGPPARVSAPPEITRIVLVAA
ncbi:MAG: metallophosphoesterase [Myxococcota bacterium]|nr:metallophosphoesterase [Myxococcota bacterium]